MNGQQVMDALDYLDDDLIEATGRQRSKKRRYHWLLPAVSAACLFLVICAGMSQYKSAPEAEMLINDQSSISDGFYGTLTPESPAESAGGVEVTAMAMLRVTHITDTGFSGCITDENGNMDMKAEQIVIICDKDMVASLQVGDLVQVRYRKGQDNICIDLNLLDG